MKPNVGGSDRAFRALVGLAAIGAGIVFRSWWGALGLLPLLTAVIRWCPIYVPLGTSTLREEKPAARHA